MLQFVVLVRGVDGVFAEAEAHEDGLGAEDALEAGDHWDTAAAAGRDGALAEGLLEAFSAALAAFLSS